MCRFNIHSNSDVVEYTLGALHNIDAGALKRASASSIGAQLAQMPKPLICFMIGGSTSQCRYDFAKHILPSIEAVSSRIRSGFPGSIACIGSRRTAADAFTFAHSDHVFSWHPLKDDEKENPYAAALTLAEGIIVSADSISMHAEVASASVLCGRPSSSLFTIGGNFCKGKFRLFHALSDKMGSFRSFENDFEPWLHSQSAYSAVQLESMEECRKDMLWSSDDEDHGSEDLENVAEEAMHVAVAHISRSANNKGPRQFLRDISRVVKEILFDNVTHAALFLPCSDGYWSLTGRLNFEASGIVGKAASLRLAIQGATESAVPVFIPLGAKNAVSAIIHVQYAFHDNNMPMLDVLSNFALAVGRIMSKMSAELTMLVDMKSGSSSIISRGLMQEYGQGQEEQRRASERGSVYFITAQEDFESNVKEQCDVWSWNVLDYDDSALKRNSVHMLSRLARGNDLIALSRISDFVERIASGYFASNPYHNFHHGVGVLHFSYMLATESSAKEILIPEHKFALGLAALGHDISHNGRTNVFHVKTQSDLALRYNDYSVLEMHHAATTWRTVLESRMLEDYNMMQQQRMRSLIIKGILATDMARHAEHTRELRERTALFSAERRLGGNPFESDPEELVAVIIHSADLSNPVFGNFEIVRKWAERICAEFGQQAREERAQNLPVSAPHFEGTTGSDAESTIKMATLQIGFIDYVVAPWWRTLGECFPVVKLLCMNLEKNRRTWKEIAAGQNVPSRLPRYSSRR
eukprot:g789.t1